MHYKNFIENTNLDSVCFKCEDIDSEPEGYDSDLDLFTDFETGKDDFWSKHVREDKVPEKV